MQTMMWFFQPVLAVDQATLSRGLAIAMVGLVIVFTALLLISLFIAGLPRILGRLARIWPEGPERHAVDRPLPPPDSEEGAVLAAIGFVLHTELQRQLSDESTSGKRGG